MNEIPVLKPIKEKVRKFRGELLAEIGVPMNYAGEHWITVSVYGKIVPAEYESLSGRATVKQYSRGIEEMTCYIDDVCVDNILPESLVKQFEEEITRGDFD